MCCSARTLPSATGTIGALHIHPALLRYLPLMLLRGSTIVLKFGLSFYVARFIGLSELGVYGLVVGATLVLPNFYRAGLTSSIARTLLDAEPAHMTHDLRHYLIWTFAGYGLSLALLPFIQRLDFVTSLQLNVYVVWLIVLAEHLAADLALLLNNLYRSRAANVFGLLQTALWVLPFVALGLWFPALRSLPALLGFWAAGALLSMLGCAALFARWPWRGGPPLQRSWFASNLRASGYLYFSDLTGTLGQFVDRYLIAVLIDIEHAGIYTLFFQLANAIYTLVSSSIVNIHRPKVLSAFQQGEVPTAVARLRALQKESLASMVALSLLTGVLFHFAAPVLNRPMVLLFLPLLWCTFAATFCKAWCLTSFIELYARRYDRELFWLNVLILVLVSLGCVAGIPLMGIYGIPLATGLTYLCILVLIRRTVQRKNKGRIHGH
jgi:O-antigen/teichoic acid export membrane protein